ncbi:hypothetical protein ABCR94_36430, partial [Streptomyces sp. 21So2-11]
GVTGAVAAAIPVVGWVALGVAGAYFLGSWAWDKWGDDVKAGAKKAWNATTKRVGEIKDKGVEIYNGVRGAVNNIEPSIIKKFAFW